jgi:hypothetical protein
LKGLKPFKDWFKGLDLKFEDWLKGRKGREFWPKKERERLKADQGFPGR